MIAFAASGPRQDSLESTEASAKEFRLSPFPLAAPMSMQWSACVALRWDSNDMASSIQNGDGETEGTLPNSLPNHGRDCGKETKRNKDPLRSARDHRRGRSLKHLELIASHREPGPLIGVSRRLVPGTATMVRGSPR